MFGIGWAELLVIGIVALVVVGPEKMPEAARTLGKAYGYIHRALMEARAGLKAETDLLDLDSRPTRTPDESKESAADEHRPIPPGGDA